MAEVHEEELAELQRKSQAAFSTFQITNEFAQLEEAIEHLNSYHEKSGPGDDGKFGHLAFKLAECLQARYERGKDPQEISNAISNAEYATKALPTDLDEQEKLLVLEERSRLLSKCLVSQGLSKDCRKPESLGNANTVADAAVRALEALGLTDKEGYIKALRQSARCKQLLWDRYERVEDLETSLLLTFKVLDWSKQHSYNDERAQILGEVSSRLLRAYNYHLQTGKHLALEAMEQPDDSTGLGERVIQNLIEADSLPIQRQLTKLDNIISIVEYLDVLPKEDQRFLLGKLSRLLQSNVRRLKDVMQASLSADITEHATNYFGLSRYAAAAALEAGEDAFSALHVLEEGRDMTSNFGIKQSPPVLNAPLEEVERYEQLKQQLTRAIEEEVPYQERLAAVASLRAFEQNASWTDCIKQSAVTYLASDAPIVVVNMTKVRSDAFIITHKGVHSVWLPNLDEKKVSKVSWGIQWRLTADAYPDPGKKFRKLRLRLYSMLELLWRHAIKPILDDLGFMRREDDVSRWPRICWIPTGLLSLYPIGLAGLGLGRAGNAFNRVVSTYAPSLKSLLASTARTKVSSSLAEESGISATVLAMTTTEGETPMDVWEHPEEAPKPTKWQSLDFSKEEANIVKKHISYTTVQHQPTSDEVIKALQKGCSIIHLSCHGYVDYISPSKSMLLFEDWDKNPLSVQQISRANIRSRLAVLSACFTANSGYEGLQDEPSHLTASCYNAGFQIVVGTLWSVGQSYARTFFETFYQYLASHSMDGLRTRVVAEAVHVAILKVANTTITEGNENLGDPTQWAPFICFGI